MGTTLAILMVLGIFVGIPAVIGFAIAGVHIMRGKQTHRAKHAKAIETTTGAFGQEAAEVNS